MVVPSVFTGPCTGAMFLRDRMDASTQFESAEIVRANVVDTLGGYRVQKKYDGYVIIRWRWIRGIQK